MPFFCLSRVLKSRQPGNDAAATSEGISSISNPQLAKAKIRSTTTGTEVARINNQNDIQTSTETKTKTKTQKKHHHNHNHLFCQQTSSPLRAGFCKVYF
jgi:hypothetical protein